MGDVWAAGDKDPYMQAYITARMKNQVEDMKLQKLLSGMEMSQRLRKIMINMELFEDRKNAHRLQQEVMELSSRQSKNMKHFLQHQSSRHQVTSDWTATLLPIDPPPNLTTTTTNNMDSAAGDVTQPHPAPHPPPPFPLPSHDSHKGVYLTTKGREPGLWRGGENEKREGSTYGRINRGEERGKGDWFTHGSKDTCDKTKGGKWATTVVEPRSGVPMIVVTDCGLRQQERKCQGTHESGNKKPVKRPVSTSELGIRINMEPASEMAMAKTSSVIPTTPPMSAPQRIPHPPDCENYQYGNSPPGVLHFPPVFRSNTTTTRPGFSRSHQLPPSQERKRLPSASHLWPGDPRAISSVRRDRRNIKDMLAATRAGEETRRLLREAVPSCSRNCSQLDIISQMEKTYINLPDLLPEIEKARQRLAEEEEDEDQDQSQKATLLGSPRQMGVVESAGKRRAHGRFDIEGDEDDQSGTKNLPIYQIDYKSLRQMGASRRNSVLA